MKKQLLLLASLIPVLAFAQNPETPKNNIPDSLTTKIFHLGEVVIRMK